MLPIDFCQDRAGVGMSGERVSTDGRDHASPEQCNQDLVDLLNECGGADSKWIFVGPSMGAVMSTIFIADHPERVVGYLNVDGTPAALRHRRTLFERVRLSLPFSIVL
jgi:pimeloyl-ACP methyl ester carboxylesterase